RWESHQKNFPLMLKVLNGVLQQHPDWTALLLGTLPRNGAKALSRLGDVAERIVLGGSRPHAKVCEELSRSRIFVMTSRTESFGIAAAEALCCGTSVVGPAHIASVP